MTLVCLGPSKVSKQAKYKCAAVKTNMQTLHFFCPCRLAWCMFSIDCVHEYIWYIFTNIGSQINVVRLQVNLLCSSITIYGCKCTAGQFTVCVTVFSDNMYNLTECTPDTFKCGDGRCLKGHVRCDDTDNCPDRSDQISCRKYQ